MSFLRFLKGKEIFLFPCQRGQKAQNTCRAGLVVGSATLTRHTLGVSGIWFRNVRQMKKASGAIFQDPNCKFSCPDMACMPNKRRQKIFGSFVRCLKNDALSHLCATDQRQMNRLHITLFASIFQQQELIPHRVIQCSCVCVDSNIF